MNKLKVAYFKAFENEVVIQLQGKKNFLLYGENGSGKSSLYEALKVVFFKDKLISKISAQTPEDLVQLQSEFWSSFNNKVTNQPFTIEINDTSYNVFDTENYQVFMFSIHELYTVDSINLKTLLDRCFCFEGIDQLCESFHQEVETNVNNALEKFNESIKIQIDEEDNFSIKITDEEKNIETKSDLKHYFNEAKLNLITFLIFIEIVNKSKLPEKSKILVLDDFITSLDAANRIFLTKYILENFEEYQILIFTHNISYYNLVMYVINDFTRTVDKWKFGNVFEIKYKHKLIIKSEIEKTLSIQNEFEALTEPISQADIDTVGNKIRKKFETLLYEYSKLLMIGSVEDSKKILERIISNEGAYFKEKKTASNLVDQIQVILAENNQNNLIRRLTDLIISYKNLDYPNFQNIIKELKLYQKVSMHPLSHGVNGMPTFTIKEIEKSLILLQKMEDYIKDMVNKNVAEV